MPESDYGDFDDDDFIAAGTQRHVRHSPNAGPQFADSARPPKRRKVNGAPSRNHSEAENIAPLNRSASSKASNAAVVPRTLFNGRSAVVQGSFATRWQQQQSLSKQQASSDSDDSAFDPAPLRPKAVPIKSLNKINPQPVQESLVNSRTGVGRSASKPVEPNIVDAVGLSESDDGFDPPLAPVVNTPLAVRSVQTASHQESHPPSFDIARELEGLPSDAFDSSSPRKHQDDGIWISSGEQPARPGYVRAPQTGLRQTTLFGTGIHAMSSSFANKQLNFPVPAKEEPPTHHKLESEALKTWVYPTNLGTIRDYQFNIVQRGLFHNLLVALPTGLGKTFIAATIMLNWFRWTTDAQIIFVAPTKPLVTQQVQACFGIAGIPRSATTLLTGETPPGIRAEEWASKRVFFMTPQTVMNDLKTGTCDPKRIVLIVIDEAHKATGAYAYVEIVKFVRRFNESFRVLALTATPGSDVESVQNVIDNLDIARVEIRTEQSLDIRQYVHSRKIEKFVFENSEEMDMCMDLYCKAVQPVLSKLNGMNAYWCKDPLRISPFGCQQARAQWMASDAGRRAHFGVKGMVNSIFTVLASLSHSMDLLKYHGMTPFYQGLIGFQNNTGEKQAGTKYRQQILDNENFSKLMTTLKTWCNHSEFIGHPKLEFLREVVLNHFLDAGEGRGLEGQPPSSTRVMIFAHWRDSAEEIVKILKRNEPMIRPHVFVGQAASKNSEGMDQKKQLEIIHKFKTGVYNTIVATSIGEEGLDIGEVDMIVCYDSKASPIRMLQRMGRTGRKRAGKIILLQMKGKEEDDAIKARDNYEKMQEMIACGARFAFHEERNRKIVPKDIQPMVDKRNVYIPQENSQQELPEPKKRAGRQPKRPPKKFHMPDNVRTGFVRASRMDNDEEDDLEIPVPPIKIIRDEPYPVPALDEVLLTEREQRDLDNCYLNVVDGDNQEILPPSLISQPARQRRLGKTFAFRRPGRAATEFVGMINRMRTVDQVRLNSWTKAASSTSKTVDPSSLPSVGSPSSSALSSSDDDGTGNNDEDEMIESSHHFVPPPTRGRGRGRGRGGASLSRGGKAPAARSRPNVSAFIADYTLERGRSSSPPGSDPRMRIRSQAVSLGSDDTEGEQEDEGEPESELAAFIAGDDEEVEVQSSSQLPSWLDESSSLREERRVQQHVIDDIDDDDDDDDDLPPVATLGRGRLGAILRTQTELDDEDIEDSPVVVRKRVAVGRRIIVDDSDKLSSSI